jgi:hypothetical protein
MSLTHEDVAVGESVYCLAWLGPVFTVVDVEESSGRVSIETATAKDTRGIQIDLFPDMMFMITQEPWDQIWYWPDRAGEHYDAVYERFVGDHPAGSVLCRWVPAGPAVGARLGMRGYRWSLSFGEFVLNWTDLVQRLPGHEDFYLPLPKSVTNDVGGDRT